MAAQPQAAAAPADTPFFIVCSGRSGSTLLSSMLNMHSAIHVPVELETLYRDLPGRLAAYGDLTVAFNRTLLARDLARTGEMSLFATPFDCDAFERHLMAQEGYKMLDVVTAFYRTLREGSGKRRIGDRTPGYQPRFRWIRTLFPEAPIIHLVRDGRDCALSAMAWRRGINYRNVDSLAGQWARLNGDLDTFGKNNPGLYLRVHYEELLENPDRTLARVTAFLGERYEVAMLDYAKGDFGRKIAARFGHHANLEKGLIRGNHNKWRHAMSPRAITIYEDAAGEVLEQLGYPLSAGPMGLVDRVATVGMRTASSCRLVIRRLRRMELEWRFRSATSLKRRFQIQRLRELSNQFPKSHS